jgi:hypothetical protein
MHHFGDHPATIWQHHLDYWQFCFEEKASTCIFILDTNRRSRVTDWLVEWKHQVCLVWDKDIYMLIFFLPASPTAKATSLVTNVHVTKRIYSRSKVQMQSKSSLDLNRHQIWWKYKVHKFDMCAVIVQSLNNEEWELLEFKITQII